MAPYDKGIFPHLRQLSTQSKETGGFLSQQVGSRVVAFTPLKFHMTPENQLLEKKIATGKPIIFKVPC